MRNTPMSHGSRFVGLATDNTAVLLCTLDEVFTYPALGRRGCRATCDTGVPFREAVHLGVMLRRAAIQTRVVAAHTQEHP